MAKRSAGKIGRFALFGEDNAAIPPEFVHIEPISTRSSRYEWSIAAHTHPGIFQLLLLERGSGRLAADGVVHDLAPTTLAVVPSGAVHAFDFAVGAEGWVLSIAHDLLGEIGAARWARSRSLAEGAAAALPIHRPGRIGWLFAQIAEDLSGGRSGTLPETTMALLALLLACTGQAARETQSAAPVGHPGREQLAQRFRALVEQHFRESWPIGHYAATLGTTPATLTRACREVLSRPPGDVVLDRLLLEAMRALTFTALGVGRIAEDLGFSDPAYFARFFKARTGMTASRFRADRMWLSEP